MYKKLFFFVLLTVLSLGISLRPADAQVPPGHVEKKGMYLDIRSLGRQIADEVAEFGNLVPADELTPVPFLPVVPQIQFRGGNVQTNDANLDNIQIFPGFRP